MMLKFDRGFTLVETMVALTVLAIGMAGVGTMLHDSMAQNIGSVSSRNMDAVAQEIVEDLKGQLVQMRYADIENLTLSNSKLNPPLYEVSDTSATPKYVDKRGMAYNRFIYKWRVEQQPTIDGTGVEPMVKVDVTVAWDNAQTAAVFPRDPDNLNYWKFKTKICNFVMSR
jgi:prepilin-type N-terminal cleavage/methylation domain-containing protein